MSHPRYNLRTHAEVGGIENARRSETGLKASNIRINNSRRKLTWLLLGSRKTPKNGTKVRGTSKIFGRSR
jgi:hypothetical protein